MREGTIIIITIGIVIAYFSLTWLIYDWITKPIAEIIISVLDLETRGSLNEGAVKLTVQLMLPVIIVCFVYIIVKIISDVIKDMRGV